MAPPAPVPCVGSSTASRGPGSGSSGAARIPQHDNRSSSNVSPALVSAPPPTPILGPTTALPFNALWLSALPPPLFDHSNDTSTRATLQQQQQQTLRVSRTPSPEQQQCPTNSPRSSVSSLYSDDYMPPPVWLAGMIENLLRDANDKADTRDARPRSRIPLLPEIPPGPILSKLRWGSARA